MLTIFLTGKAIPLLAKSVMLGPNVITVTLEDGGTRTLRYNQVADIKSEKEKGNEDTTNTSTWPLDDCAGLHNSRSEHN